MTDSTDVRQNLIVLPGATISEGLDALRDMLQQAHDDASKLAPVVPIRPVESDKAEGKRQGAYRDHDNSLAECEGGCEWSARQCPKHWPERYADKHAKHRSDREAVSA